MVSCTKTTTYNLGTSTFTFTSIIIIIIHTHLEPTVLETPYVRDSFNQQASSNRTILQRTRRNGALDIINSLERLSTTLLG
ncbi:hypothetical protein K440DRAFT_626742 [Wilcoxina mikolae CBS 423.85]|nr:hypothetical protein K440DRAFT_626742 [Wilcoxina mikolae CBS 423.85]